MLTRREHLTPLAVKSLLTILLLLLVAGCQGRPRPEPLMVSQIIEMSRAGVHPDEIIARMRESEAVYRLDASRLADLRDQGGPDEVIDYMQQTYLDAVRGDQRLQDPRYWTPGGPGWWYRGGPQWPYSRWGYW